MTCPLLVDAAVILGNIRHTIPGKWFTNGGEMIKSILNDFPLISKNNLILQIEIYQGRSS